MGQQAGGGYNSAGAAKLSLTRDVRGQKMTKLKLFGRMAQE